MAKMRTGRKNNVNGGPPDLAPLRPRFIRDEKGLQSRYGDQAYRYSSAAADDDIPITSYKGKTNYRMPKKEYEGILERNKSKLSEYQSKMQEYNTAMQKDAAAQSAYEKRKTEQAEKMKQYDAAMKAGDYLDITDWENREKIGSKLEGSMTGAQYYGGRALTPGEEQAYIKKRQKADPSYNLLPGSKIIASDPEWISYDLMEEGAEKGRVGKKIYESEFAKDKDIQKAQGMYGPVEKHMYTKAISKPAEFTEERPTRLAIPDKPSYPSLEEEPKTASALKERKLRKVTQEAAPEWEAPKPDAEFRRKSPKMGKMKDKYSRQARRKQQVEGVKRALGIGQGPKDLTYEQEGELAKAYFGGETGTGTYEGSGVKDIEGDISMYKEMRKSVRSDKDLSRAEKREKISDYKAGIQKAKKAKEYLERADQPTGFDSSRSDSYNSVEGTGIKTWTPEAMKGYEKKRAYDERSMLDMYSNPEYTGAMSSMLRATRKKK